jgi:hypothetical protein
MVFCLLITFRPTSKTFFRVDVLMLTLQLSVLDGILLAYYISTNFEDILRGCRVDVLMLKQRPTE